MIIKYILSFWEIVNKLNPEIKSLIIILLFGCVLYTQITYTTRLLIAEQFKKEIVNAKQAEVYSLKTSGELCNIVLSIAEKDKDAFDVLLLNYHNNTSSLQGYKYLYLSCLTEAPRSIDTPLLRLLWNKIDYIYYADELSKIHREGFVLIEDIELMKNSLPKLYRLVKASDAKAISFFTIEGYDSAIGMIILLYKEPKKHDVHKIILPQLQRLAVILDYENIKK